MTLRGRGPCGQDSGRPACEDVSPRWDPGDQGVTSESGTCQ